MNGDPEGRTYFVTDSLIQRGPTSWRWSYHPVFPDGTCGERQWETVTGCRYKREAKAAVARRLVELETEGPGQEKDMPTLLAYTERTAKKLRSIGKIGEDTASRYVGEIRNCGDMAELPMDEVTEDHVMAMMARLQQRSLARETINKRVQKVRLMYAYGIGEGIVSKNPCLFVPTLPRTARRVKGLAPFEGEALKRALPFVDWRLRMAISIALATGMRGEEVCGLQWGDWQGDTISVERACIRSSTTGKAVVKEPKTPKSLRVLPVSFVLRAALLLWCTEQNREFEDAGCEVSPADFILGLPGGSPCNPQRIRELYRELARSLGIEGGFHRLRHTFATKLGEDNVDSKTIAYWLGHVSPWFSEQNYVDQSLRKMRESLASTYL